MWTGCTRRLIGLLMLTPASLARFARVPFTKRRRIFRSAIARNNASTLAIGRAKGESVSALDCAFHL